MPAKGQGGQAPSRSSPGSACGTSRRRPRPRAMAAVPSLRLRLLAAGRAYLGAALPERPPVSSNVSAFNPCALGHRRAQDFGATVGRERSS
ncbi:hypothetical protein NDU88_005090 [Pleurodeles waltl]|uniref:Uncharacterized protein n=1 Tax=Pleurodeles waltl TaxID=8319 RepID=A0AAV7VIY2_PLEWA|nr:hypothetical protein NDU88_005090 [Pleurodeles waltl]